MNARILSVSTGGRDASALIDQRQQMIDRIGGLIPIREIVRDNGTVALMAPGGLMLLDGRPATLGFTPAGVIVPEMTQGSGALSGLTVNGRPVATSGTGSPLAGGRLAALFDVRDTSGVAAQAQLDALSRDLVERFADPAIDATRAPGGPGLLTDAGGAFLPANEVGLAQRLTLNPAADPAQGGALWRLRDGLGATLPGPPGEAGLVRALAGALNAQRQPVSGSFMAGERGFSTLAADLLSGVSGQRVQRDSAAAFSAASLTALQEIEAQDGVDSDQELQSLLQIEKAYAANAKVIQALDDMLQSLIGIA
jgi:flagellar hook-associated protein 1